MSLVAQMVRDLDAEQQPAADKRGELPLFAAAEQLYGKQQSRSKWTSKLPLLFLLLSGLAMAWAAYHFLMPKQSLGFVQSEQLSHELDQKVASTAMPEVAKTLVTSELATSKLVTGKETVTAAKPINNKSTVEKTAAVASVKSDSSAQRVKPVITEPKPTRLAENTAVETKANNTVDVATKTIDSVSSNTSGRRLIQSANNVATLNVKTTRPLSNAELDLQIKSQAEQLLASGLKASAINHLQEKLAGDVSKIKSASLYASLLIESQSYQLAGNLLQGYQQANPDDLAFSKLQVRLAIAQQNFAQALTQLDRLAIPVNRDAGFTEMRAAIFQAQGSYSDAAASYRQLLQYDNQQSRWWMGLAISLDADAKFNEAKQAYRRAMFATDLPDNLSLYASRRIAQL